MTNTDSAPFQDLVAAISLRERTRRADRCGLGHALAPPTNVYSTFSDKDFQLGLNAAQTTLAAIAHWRGVDFALGIAPALGDAVGLGLNA